MRSLTFLLCGLLLAGCADDEGSSTYLAATIDGARWSAPASEGEVAYSVDHPEGGWIYTIASRPYHNGHQHLVLDLPIAVSVGTYPLDGAVASGSFLSCPDDVLADCIWWGPVASDPGTLEITAFDIESGRVEGTFAFDAYPLGDSTGAAKQFTQGKFAISARGVFVLE